MYYLIKVNDRKSNKLLTIRDKNRQDFSKDIEAYYAKGFNIKFLTSKEVIVYR